MNYGLQISASGLLGAMYRQDVFSNNLANMDTVGFKPDIPSMKQRLVARVEDNIAGAPSDAMLERLGAGVLAMPTRVDLAQGSAKVTGNPFDVAIEGDGFFQLQGGPRDAGRTALLTRDGRFTRNAEGKLVQAASGAAVLDHTGRSITLPPGEVSIASNGRVFVDKREVGRIGVYDIPNKAAITKRGGTVMEAPASQVVTAAESAGLVKQGQLEESGVDEIKALMAVQGASREVDANVSVIQATDRMLERAINTFGRLA
ncbi:MAG: flagellar hook-basal body protein [Phycisphaerales bacterium]|nr:flagellar hook-basal body protein [Phycisphaerales bacterium]